MKAEKNLNGKLVNIHTRIWIFPFALLMFIATSGQAQTWSLEQCIDTAQIHNKSLQIGRNNMTIGEQKQKEATANLFPKVNVVGDYKYFTDLPYQLMSMSAFNPTKTRRSIQRSSVWCASQYECCNSGSIAFV